MPPAEATNASLTQEASFPWWDVDVLAEGEDYVAFWKPSGMSTTPQRGQWESVASNFLHVANRRLSPKRKEGVLGTQEDSRRQRGLCGRLDVGTSGVQMLGKNADACHHYERQAAAHRVTYDYFALVDGHLGDPGMESEGVIDVPLRRWQDHTRREYGTVACHLGQPAVTKYRVLRRWQVRARDLFRFWKQDRWFSLVQLQTLTDRPQQLRAHLAFAGHPVVCDNRHGGWRYEGDCAIAPRIFVHCWRVAFEDKHGKPFEASCGMAPDLQAALARLDTLADPTASGPSAPLGRGADQHVDADASDDREGFGLVRPASITRRCAGCGLVATCAFEVLRRGDHSVSLWTLRASVEQIEGVVSPDGCFSKSARDIDSWGATFLWLPSLLRPQLGPAPLGVAGRASPRSAVTATS
eukprot:TRINITY_DN5944_c0_g2_i1.p1 TRINITY_DN5944_c0_g2~~TRINITY_DN5944_c0_g2_i1.p1  ORF type:complete len:459 (-),score=67.30 TRINITY_DN5944_c0_g2_i1:76-1308(-)